jgi:hypothetical protein
VQRWFVTSFCADGFESCCHECADAAIGAYKVRHDRSRESYDLTMLEVRRVLYDDLPPREPIIPGRLFGTRCAWMARFAHLLDADEFKFFVLLRDLSPFCVLLVDLSNWSRRRRQTRRVAAVAESEQGQM